MQDQSSRVSCTSRIVQVPLSKQQTDFFNETPFRPEASTQAVHLIFRTPVSLKDLSKAITYAINYHHIFRASFEKAGMQWKQQFSIEKLTPRLEHMQLPQMTISPELIQDQIARLSSEIDFSCPPLAKFLFISAEEASEGHLLVVVHTLLIDAHGFDVFLRDIQNTYEHLAEGTLHEPTLRRHYWRHWANEASVSAAPSEAELLYLKKQMITQPQEDYLESRVLASEESPLQSIGHTFDKTLTDALSQITRRITGIHHEHLLTAALGYAYYRLSQTNQFNLHLEDAARMAHKKQNLSCIVGNFARIIPLKIQIPRGQNADFLFQDMLFEIRSALEEFRAGSRPFPSVFPPIEEDAVRSNLCLKFLGSVSPRATSYWGHRDYRMLYQHQDSENPIKYPLQVVAGIQNNQLNCHFDFDAHCFSPATIARFIRYFGFALERMAQTLVPQRDTKVHKTKTEQTFVSSQV